MSSWEMIPGRNHIHVVVGTIYRLGGGVVLVDGTK